MTDLFDTNIGGAQFSEDRKYRYCLWRTWDMAKPKCMFIGLNPSTANEHQNDPTIRRVIDFALKWGYGGVYMLNCFPFVSTHPEEALFEGNTEINDDAIKFHAAESDIVVFAWGAFDVAKQRGEELARLFPNAYCLGKNKDGSPKHPLYVPAKTKLILYGQTHP